MRLGHNENYRLNMTRFALKPLMWSVTSVFFVRATANKAAGGAKSEPDVYLFVSGGWDHCDEAKQFLKQLKVDNGIHLREHDIDSQRKRSHFVSESDRFT